jgi:hypothetical protein
MAQVNATAGNALWGGVLLSILGNLHWQDVTRTIVLGVIGTTASFFASALLKKLWHRRKQ